MSLLREYTDNLRQDRDRVELERVTDGWSCIFRTGLSSDPNDPVQPIRILHVWEKTVR